MAEKYPQVGDDKNLLLLTGELLFQPEGELGFINIGVGKMHQLTPNSERKTIVRSLRFNQKRTVREDTVNMDLLYGFESEEHTAEMIELMIFGEQLADETQAAVTEAATVTIADVVQRRSYAIGKRNVTDVTVTVAAAAKVLGTDYLLDAMTGMIYIIDGGTIVDGDDLTVTYKCPAITSAKFKALTRTQREGAFKLVQTDAQSTDARMIHDFNGVISVDSSDDFGGDQHKVKLRIRPTSQPVITMPPVA
ncbi:MAG: hypothetical protein WA117_20950 [Verrucomicrobiia bacterium]